MAASHGTDAARVVDEITSLPWDFDFFHALRMIECHFPDLPRIGRSKYVREDAMRFGQFLSLSFATSSLEQTQAKNTEPNKLNVRFTGLTGPNGPLPLRMTEFIRNRLYGIYDMDLRGTSGDSSKVHGFAAPKDATLAAFLDIFHHRLISLFYRAWAVAQKTVDFDRDDDRCFAVWLASFFGCGENVFNAGDSIPVWRKLPFTGFLASPQRHLSGLRSILATFFVVPAECQPLCGHWLDIPHTEQCRIGEAPATGVLGLNCVVGSKMWDRQLKFSVALGPMNYERFQSFLPKGESHRYLHDWIAFYTRREYFWEASIILHKNEVPQIFLGKGGRLGYTTWLSSLPFDDHVSNFKLRGGGVSAGDNL